MRRGGSFNQWISALKQKLLIEISIDCYQHERLECTLDRH